MLTVLSLFPNGLQDVSSQRERGGLQKADFFRDAPSFEHGPLPFCGQAAAHTGLGTGLFFAITLVVGVTALGAYSYFRLNRRIIGFQRFEVRERRKGTW